MRTRLLALLLSVLILFSPSLFASEIYKIVHADGTVSYSDQPPLDEQADEVALPDLFVTPAVPVPAASAMSAAQTPPAQSKAVRIHAPMDEEVIRGADNRLSIAVSVTPAIEENERLQLFHNGSPYSSPQSSGQWNLMRLNPGTHKFSVQLLDASGENRGQSRTVTVYVIL